MESKIRLGRSAGSIGLNNSKATENNKSWRIPVPIGEQLVHIARSLSVPGFDMKLRTFHSQNFNDYPKGVVYQG